ncbi:MAG: hypothetical protein IT169_00215 [Bryobacterales bacterium]|nr:hypothetical protein [Bryobacterales bacterium]
MALLTDRDWITVRDLLAWENDLLETADRERVDLETKMELGADEVRTETETEVDAILRSGAEGGSGNTGAIASIANVVATPGLLRWAHARTLALFYFECWGRQLNDRFRRKFEHYREQAEAAKQDYLQRGIGVVDLPLPRPAALSGSPGSGALPAGSYYFAGAWTNTRGQQSSLGALATAVLENAAGLVLEAPSAPVSASGWNVYLGNTPDQLYRQNTAPIALGSAWPQATALDLSAPFLTGQMPDRYLRPQRIFHRG